MALEPEFLEMAEDTINHQALSTVSIYGAPTHSTTVSTFDVHMEWEQRLITTAEGKEEVSQGTIYVMSSSASIAVQDLITLSTVYDNRKPRLLRADPLMDDEGLHHWELSI